MKLHELSAAALLACEQKANALCKQQYGDYPTDLAVMLCEVAALYSMSVQDHPRMTAAMALQQCTAGQLATFFEQYQQQFFNQKGVRS